MGASPAATGIADPVNSEPATPSARIAGIKRSRLIRMTPPWHFPRPAARCTAPPARTAYLPSCGLISQHLIFLCALGKQFLVISRMMRLPILIARNTLALLQKIFSPYCGVMFTCPCTASPVRLAVHGAATLAMPLLANGQFGLMNYTKNAACVRNVLVVKFAPCPPPPWPAR